MEVMKHQSYVKLTKVSLAVTSYRKGMLADNMDSWTPPGIQEHILYHTQSQDTLSVSSHHPLLTLFGSVRTLQPIFTQAEALSPRRQICSPLTHCSILVSVLNNKISSRIIQLFCSQAENVQKAVTIKMPFPLGK